MGRNEAANTFGVDMVASPFRKWTEQWKRKINPLRIKELQCRVKHPLWKEGHDKEDDTDDATCTIIVGNCSMTAFHLVVQPVIVWMGCCLQHYQWIFYIEYFLFCCSINPSSLHTDLKKCMWSHWPRHTRCRSAQSHPPSWGVHEHGGAVKTRQGNSLVALRLKTLSSPGSHLTLPTRYCPYG